MPIVTGPTAAHATCRGRRRRAGRRAGGSRARLQYEDSGGWLYRPHIFGACLVGTHCTFSRLRDQQVCAHTILLCRLALPSPTCAKVPPASAVRCVPLGVHKTNGGLCSHDHSPDSPGQEHGGSVAVHPPDSEGKRLCSFLKPTPRPLLKNARSTLYSGGVADSDRACSPPRDLWLVHRHLCVVAPRCDFRVPSPVLAQTPFRLHVPGTPRHCCD
jgi:hypothetical protein